MSTYTDQLNRRKENVQILRMPGNMDDGITPQRLKLINPENEYYGKFFGEFSTTSVDLSNVAIYGSKILGSELHDVTLYSTGRVLDLNDVADELSEIQQHLSDDVDPAITDLNKAILSVEKRLDYNISCLSSELSVCSSDISVETERKINRLSLELSVCSSDISAETKRRINSLSSDLSAAHNWLSVSLSTDISVGLDSLSGNLTSYVNNQITGLQASATGQLEKIDEINKRIDGITSDVNDVVEGGVVWRKALTADIDHIPSTLSDLFEMNGIGGGEVLKRGWQYKFKTQKTGTFTGDGVRLQNGDFIIITKKTEVSNIVGGDVETIDSVDPETVLRPELKDVSGWILNNDEELSTVLSGGLSSYTDEKFKSALDDIAKLSVSLSTDLSGLSAGISGDVDRINDELLSTINVSCVHLHETLAAVSAELTGDMKNISVALGGTIKETSALVLASVDLSVSKAVEDLNSSDDDIISNLTELSGDFKTISSSITADIGNVNAAVDSTISAMDKAIHPDLNVRTKNIMLTDIGGDGNGQKYYMTLSAGTLVLVPMK